MGNAAFTRIVADGHIKVSFVMSDEWLLDIAS